MSNGGKWPRLVVDALKQSLFSASTASWHRRRQPRHGHPNARATPTVSFDESPRTPLPRSTPPASPFIIPLYTSLSRRSLCTPTVAPPTPLCLAISTPADGLRSSPPLSLVHAQTPADATSSLFLSLPPPPRPPFLPSFLPFFLRSALFRCVRSATLNPLFTRDYQVSPYLIL